MFWLFGHFEVGDYDSWKEGFDSDPAGRSEAGTGHRVYQAVDDPGKVFVAVEFGSADDAKAFREKLLSSGALDRVTVKTEPTVVEETDAQSY